MHVTMVKKRLASGDPCEKCAQAEEMLRRRGLWERIDEVVWAVEGQDDSPGARLAARHGVKLAPFFVVRGDDRAERVFTSALRLLRDCFPDERSPGGPGPREALDLAALAERHSASEPLEILRWALERYGDRCAIAVQGGEDLVLIDMATRTGLPFRAFTVDTGRLHEETHATLDEVRRRYGVAVRSWFPDAAEVCRLVGEKGPNSFYRDGHAECCAIRRLEPLRRALQGCEAWVTAKRRDVAPEGADPLPVIQADPEFAGATGPLVRINPLAGWPRSEVWRYIRTHDVPTNPLHDHGFTTVGCAPCTRPASGVREVRWWWEKDETAGELHESGDGI